LLDSKPYLITGGQGILGRALKDELFSDCYALDKTQFNLFDYSQMFNFLNTHHDEIKYVIHCAALTSLELCEKNRQLAYETNVVGTQNLINVISSINSMHHRKIKLVYISTACVFDGNTGDYDESYLPTPKNYYGLTKLIAEELVRYSKLDYIIFRTNFVERAKWKYPKAFSDRIGTYLYSDQVAKRIVELIDMVGIIHIAGKESISMLDMARKTDPNIQPITLKEYTGGVSLCRNMSLKSKLVNTTELK
jgi:dTDP-4-dehydrorhamnose reductase